MRTIRQFLIAILIIAAITALYIGLNLINDSSGRSVGLSYDDLQGTPFSSYKTPGWLLVVFIGLGSIFAALSCIQRYAYHPILVMAEGVIYFIWIIAQVLITGNVNFLIIIFTLFAIALILLGNLLRKKMLEPQHHPPSSHQHLSKKTHHHKKGHKKTG
jgi:thiol:disulfide interchange protein